MKALVVRQPWASMIASGAKSIEVRTRRTRHRGPLLIVAGCRDAAGRIMQRGGPLVESPTPAGCAVCIVEVIGCRPMTPADATAARVEFRPGQFAWELRNPQLVPHVAVRGQQGLFDVTENKLRKEENHERDL